MRLTVLSISLACLFWSCQPTAPTTENQTLSIIDSLTLDLDKLYDRGHINGYAVAIVNESGMLYEQGFGFANVAEQKPYTAKTIQNIASISKTLLGIALLKGQELGYLKLDDPINDYLPFEVMNPYFPDETITIRHLATHTATITDTDAYGQRSYLLVNAEDSALAKSIGSASEFNTPETAVPMGELLERFLSAQGEWYQKESFLEMKPGVRYEYSNIGATLAAYVLELAADQEYSAFTKQHILDPLEMSTSGWSLDAIDRSLHTKLYADSATAIPMYSLITYPDGGLITSVHDMGKYLSELIRGYHGQGKLLTQESYATFFSEQLTEENFEERDTDRPYDDEYNAGIFVGHTPIGYIGHMGGDPGVSSFMFFDPKTKLGRLLFVNRDLNGDGADQFYAVWDKLGEYQERL
ncbi:MAG: serine hydrolase domain-containing protein [Cyclobacteriaceae bacterium]